MVQILQTIQVALLLLRFGCKISAMPGTSPHPLNPIDYQDSGGLGGAIHRVCVKLFSNFTFSLDELELNPAYFSV